MKYNFFEKELLTCLTDKKCVPCDGGMPPLNPTQIGELSAQLAPGWEVVENKKIKKKFICKNFQEAIDFLNRVARLAEQEGHHPDLHLTGWNKLTIEISTHAIRGLSENDFILAAKIDHL